MPSVLFTHFVIMYFGECIVHIALLKWDCFITNEKDIAVLSRQSDETHLNNFPKDFKLPTFFSPFQRKCANLLRRHWLLYWQNSRRIILEEIVVFQIKNDKNKNNKSCFLTRVLLWHQRLTSFFFFFNFVYFFLSSNLITLTGQSVLVYIFQCHLKISNLNAGCHPLRQIFFEERLLTFFYSSNCHSYLTKWFNQPRFTTQI